MLNSLSNRKSSKKVKSRKNSPSHATMQVSELDCKKLITDYQNQLSAFIHLIKQFQRLQVKNDELQQQNKQLESKIIQTSKQITEFKTDNSNILIDQEYYQTLVSNYQKKLEQFNKLIQQVLQPECQIIDDDKNNQNNSNDSIQNKKIKSLVESQQNLNQDQKLRIIQFADNALLSQLSSKKLEQIVEILKQQNLEMKMQLSKYKKQKSDPKICITCGEEYYPCSNTDQSCVYHPGKIKYFSCRQCGGDEYYTCCLTCSTCKKGCRTRKHMSNQ